ncbi:hypothetical protein DPMN_048351 [Dreissena polymorpha]|uniref:Uncharacterized protein n=1 Tax=Dreissena polymorpha TaxID=45954 RepID=A0A9D4I3X1_DREPO|nr:hypothetical protein DPMN_048351 [Dreissena polymorpha]
MRECKNAIVRWRKCDNTMATARQYDGDNTIVRWRQWDETMATVRYDYRIVAIVLSHRRHRIVALLSYYRIVANVSRTVVIVLSPPGIAT